MNGPELKAASKEYAEIGRILLVAEERSNCFNTIDELEMMVSEENKRQVCGYLRLISSCAAMKISNSVFKEANRIQSLHYLRLLKEKMHYAEWKS